MIQKSKPAGANQRAIPSYPPSQMLIPLTIPRNDG
jgi:hypothetical protein